MQAIKKAFNAWANALKMFGRWLIKCTNWLSRPHQTQLSSPQADKQAIEEDWRKLDSDFRKATTETIADFEEKRN